MLMMTTRKINENRLLIGSVICCARNRIELIWEKKTMGVIEEVYNNYTPSSCASRSYLTQATADIRLDTNEILFSFSDRA